MFFYMPANIFQFLQNSFPFKANLCTHLFNVLIKFEKFAALSSYPFKWRGGVGMGLKMCWFCNRLNLIMSVHPTPLPTSPLKGEERPHHLADRFLWKPV